MLPNGDEDSRRKRDRRDRDTQDRGDADFHHGKRDPDGSHQTSGDVSGNNSYQPPPLPCPPQPMGGTTWQPSGPVPTPFLVIAATSADNGSRRPGGPPQSSLFANGSIAAKQVLFAPNGALLSVQLSCVIANLGAGGCFAGWVEFFVCPAIYVGVPGELSLSPQGVKQQSTLVGYAAFCLPPGASKTVVCPNPWVFPTGAGASIPPGTQAAGEAGVIVQAYDLWSDRLSNAFDALLDRHVARNDEIMDPILH